MTALAAGAGVARARILGLRNLDAGSLNADVDAMDMSMATAMADRRHRQGRLLRRLGKPFERIAAVRTA